MKPKKETRNGMTTLLSSIKENIKKKTDFALVPFIQSAQFKPYLPEFMQAAVFYRNLDMIKTLINNGCNLSEMPIPPPKDDTEQAHESLVDYRPTPHIIFAACKGYMYL